MKHSVKRVAAIHDLSGFGRASLTAIIPILSSMGVQVCPLPTAILSNHTGGFDTFSFVDFTVEKLAEAGIPAVIFGKAIYEGKIQLKDLIRFT